MSIVVVLIGSVALGIAIGFFGVYLTLTHSRDHQDGVW